MSRNATTIMVNSKEGVKRLRDVGMLEWNINGKNECINIFPYLGKTHLYIAARIFFLKLKSDHMTLHSHIPNKI